MNRVQEQNPPPRQRRYERYDFDAQMQATMLGMEQRSPMRGRSLNISEAGMAGVFASDAEIGTAVLLEFSVPTTSSPVRVGGVLRNRSGYRYGFEFADLNSVQREIINKTCRTLALLE